MPNLIKGGKIIWKDSVTLETKLPQKSSTDEKADLINQERKKMAIMEEAMKVRLEEEARKKSEGFNARYRLLTEKIEKDRIEIIEAAKAQADVIVSKAGKDANDIIEMAHGEYDKKMQQAHEEGFNAGMEIAKEEYVKTMQMLKNTIDNITSMEQYVLEKSRMGIADLTVDIFRKITTMDMDRNDEVLQSMITEQLRSFKNYKRIRINLSGFNISVDTMSNWLIQNKLLESKDYLTIQNIEDAPPGTCIIETENEMSDISMSAQIENLIKNVRNIQVEEIAEYDDDNGEEDTFGQDEQYNQNQNYQEY